MPPVKAPTLMGYDSAIQANQSMSNAFKQLGDTSQNFLNYSEAQKQNAFDNQYKTDTLNETKSQNAIGNNHWQQNFDYTKGQDDIKNGQWKQTFDHTVNQDNIKNNQWQQTFDETKNQNAFDRGYKNSVLNKPDYATFNGVDANGNPTLNLFNKNNGQVVNTGQQVYNESKKLAPEQSLYYQDKAMEMRQKSLDDMEKTLTKSAPFVGLSEGDQNNALNYLRTTGKMPTIGYSNTWGGGGNNFNGKGYYFKGTSMSDVMSKEQQKVLQDQLDKLNN